jgi:hypothetical protein
MKEFFENLDEMEMWCNTLTLGEYIAGLEAFAELHGHAILEYGLMEPHSNRGDYSNLGFTPTPNVSIGEMIVCATDCLDRVFEGYKGGDFKMYEGTGVCVSEWGSSGVHLTRLLLNKILSVENIQYG